MPVFDEKGNQINNDDDFPKLKDPEDAKTSPVSTGKKFPVAATILGIVALICAVAAVVFFLKANTLEQEVAILKKTKTQLAATEAKLQDMMKANQKIKAELAQVKNDLDAVKAKNETLESQLAKKKTSGKKSNKPGSKKTAPKKPAPKKAAPKKPAPKKP